MNSVAVRNKDKIKKIMRTCSAHLQMKQMRIEASDLVPGACPLRICGDLPRQQLPFVSGVCPAALAAICAASG